MARFVPFYTQKSMAMTVYAAAAFVVVAMPFGAYPALAGGGPNVLQSADSNVMGVQLGELERLTESTLQRVTIRRNNVDRILATITVDGQPWTLELEPHSVRSPDFQVLVQNELNGPLVPVTPPPVRTLRGTVRELPGARVRGTLIDGQLEAVVYTSDGRYGIEPVSRAGAAGPRDQYVVFRARDQKNFTNLICGTDASHFMRGLDNQAPAPAASASAGTGLRISDIGLDADFDFFQANGSDVASTVADMESIINGLGPIYEVPAIGITYEVTTCIVRTAPGTYVSSDAGTLLGEFRNVWRSAPEVDIRRDVAHLFTGKSIIGSTIGIAFVGTVCHSASGFGYGLTQSRFTSFMPFRVGVTAHELGHNWNAPHCNESPTIDPTCNIMCSGIGGCSGVVTSFTSLSAGRINSFKSTRSCLSDLLPALSVPLIESFEIGFVDSAVWSFNKGGSVNSNALAEPSGIMSLNLNAAGSREYQDDDIRSNFVLLGGATLATLTYQTEHRGVIAGNALVVDYWAADGRWVELNRLISDGVDQSQFQFTTLLLPPGASHDKFRVRFRTLVDGLTEQWYIDDVQITLDCNNNGITDPCDTNCGPQGGQCDVPGCGQSLDCNGNLAPDECETDCNGTGVPDDCDVVTGVSPDCNINMNPDECDISSGSSADCNGNAIPDECDISAATSTDCNGNGVPDACDVANGTSPDCNGNGVSDVCDIVDMTSTDCNTNAVPDECDVANGTSPDCNFNGISDVCDVINMTSADCNSNGVPDECDITSGTAQDCQTNGVPDVCDIAVGTSLDCNGPATDCFTVHVAPGCDNAELEACVCALDSVCCTNTWDSSCTSLTAFCSNCASGQSGNGVPDECEIPCGVPGDCDDFDDCTQNVCNVNNFCRFPLTYNPATECCNPVGGAILTIQDNNPCTFGACDSVNGAVTQNNLPDGPIVGCGLNDPCLAGACTSGVCVSSVIGFGDVNHDTTITVFDLFCVLDGFAGNFSTCAFDDVDIEPCTGNQSINIFDLFAVLDAFAGGDPCCAPGP